MIFDVCERKHGGNDCSVAANVRVDKEKDRNIVLDIIRAAGSHGATLDEVSARLDRPPNALSGRITELVSSSQIIRTSARRQTRTRSTAAVYVAA